MGFVSQVTQSVSNAVSDLGASIASSPIAQAIITTAGAAVGVPPMVTAGLLGANSVAQNGNLAQGVVQGLTSYGESNLLGATGATAGLQNLTGTNLSAAGNTFGAGGALSGLGPSAGLTTSGGAAAGSGGISAAQGLGLAGLLAGSSGAKPLANTGGYDPTTGALTTGVGTLYSSAQAQQAANQQASGITQASNILAPAYTAAGNMQAAAQATGANQTVAGLQAAQGNVAQTLGAQTALQQPYLATGLNANQQLATGLQQGGQFNTPFTSTMAQNSDAEQFAQAQALQAERAQMAAGGQGLGTNAIQGAGQLAGGIASQYQNQAFNQYQAQNAAAMAGLQGLSAQGQTATGQLSNALGNAGAQQSALSQGIGGAQAAGTIGSASAQAQGLLGSAGTEASAAQQAAAALAGGTVASGNIIGAGASAIGNQLSGAGTLNAILGARNTTTPTAQTNVTSGTTPAANQYSMASGVPTYSDVPAVDPTTGATFDWSAV